MAAAALRALTADEAAAVVSPYFAAARAKYAESGLNRLKRVQLVIDPVAHDTDRHFAACREDGLLIVLAPEIADLEEDYLVGIVAHELGHAADFLYPGRYQLVDGKLVEWDHPDWSRKQRGAPIDGKLAFNRRTQWQSRSAQEVELTADAVAGRVFGRPVRYAGPCMLQTFSRPGVTPRPAHLV